MNSNRNPLQASKKIEVLQAGRAIAAVLVVGHHTNQAVNAFIGQSTKELRGFLEHCYLGVDFFFVLSGFIIYFSVVRKKEFEFQSYLRSRLNRIFAPYLPIGIAMAILYSALPVVSENEQNWGWLTSLTLLPSEDRPALSVAWTLRHELVFYLVFGLLFLYRRLWIGFGVWAALILAYEMFFSASTDSKILRQLFGSINVEFLFGLIVAKLFLENKKPNYWVCVSILIIPFVIWMAIGSIRDQSWLVGLSLSAGIRLLVDLEIQDKIRIPQFLSILGNGSYSIYLIHPLIVSLSARIARKFMAESELGAFVFIFVLSVAAGMIYYVTIEKPLVNFLRKKRSRTTAETNSKRL